MENYVFFLTQKIGKFAVSTTQKPREQCAHMAVFYMFVDHVFFLPVTDTKRHPKTESTMIPQKINNVRIVADSLAGSQCWLTEEQNHHL